MAEQFFEIISGEKAVIDTLRSMIASRVVCKMEIPRTDRGWITLLLEIRNVGNAYHLLIDNVAGFAAALSKYPEQEVSLEFTEKGGVPGRFHTRIIACHPREILAELPKVIHRIQRRQYFRIEAAVGTEITFLEESSTERKRAKVKDYSAGGLAFFMEKDWKFNVAEGLPDIHLNIPEGQRVIRFKIPRAAIKRIEPEFFHGRKALCAIEFTEIPGPTRNNIFSHVLRQQRVGIQRTGN